MEDNEDFDPPPQMILPLKTFMVEQNLQSWLLDTSPPSPQFASLLNKAMGFKYGLSSHKQPNLSLVTYMLCTTDKHMLNIHMNINKILKY